MLKALLSIKDMPSQLDATDGLAAAVCHYFQKDPDGNSNNYSGWKQFVNKNPGRLKKL